MTNKQEQDKVTAQKSEGYEAVSASWKTAPTKVRPDTIPKLQNNVHYQDALTSKTIQIYPAPPEIWVTDGTGETDENLTAETLETFERINGWDLMRNVIPDIMGYGCSIFSPGIDKKDNHWYITEIRHLPPQTFSTHPPIGGNVTIANPLLPGIIVTPEGETQVWQINHSTGAHLRIQNFRIIKMPGTPTPSGMAYMYPVYHLIAMIDFAMQAEIQQVNRVGAPILLPKVSEEADDLEYDLLAKWFKEFGKQWGKDTTALIPKGIEFPALNIREGTVAQQFVNQCVSWIRAFSNPMSEMQQTGTGIGTSDSGRMEIWATHIASFQNTCEQWLEQLFDEILRANGYKDHHTHIRLKRPSVDKSALRIEALRLAYDTKSITKEETRDNLTDILDLKIWTPELEAELNTLYPPSAAGIFGNTKGISRKQNTIIENTQREIDKITDEAETAILRIMGYDKE